MRQRTAVVIVFSAMTMVTVMLLAGHGPWAGRPVLKLSERHGLNIGDVIPIAAWVASAVCCAVLWRRAD
jgi:hypothetical protein